LLDENADHTYAASLIGKFRRFATEGMDVVAVQLQALDMARKKAERRATELDVKSARFLFRTLAFDLERCRDGHAVAKLRETAASHDPEIRRASERSLRKLEAQVREHQIR
jgi:hypothetical protein